jgi:hypothetical protein
MRFIYFLLLFTAGLLIIIYREKIQRVSGNFAFAEKWFGNGGTYTFYILLGFGTIIFSVAYGTGTLDGLVGSTVGRFFLTPG